MSASLQSLQQRFDQSVEQIWQRSSHQHFHTYGMPVANGQGLHLHETQLDCISFFCLPLFAVLRNQSLSDSKRSLKQKAEELREQSHAAEVEAIKQRILRESGLESLANETDEERQIQLLTRLNDYIARAYS